MRRILAGSALVAALFTAAACGNDDGGDGNGDPTPDATGGGSMSTEEVCAAGEALIGQFAAVGAAFIEAGATGDQAALAEASAELTRVTGEVTGQARELAADTADPDLAATIEAYGAELDAFAAAVAADPSAWESVDTSGLEAVEGDLNEFCG